jgi:ribosomal protein L11 methyltransferase
LGRQQLSLRVAAAQVPIVESLLELAGADSIALADAGDEPVLEPDPNQTPLWPDVVVRAHFVDDVDLAGLRRALRDHCGAESELRPVADEEWRPALRAQIPAKRIGDRIWLAPAGDPAGDPRLATVRLHMGLAFGTGEHPTTALCLEWLAAHFPKGASVLDYGCGSGVLALAALALGASRAWAVDNDPQALVATADNADLNGLRDRLWIGAPDELPDVEVDVVLANILVGPLERLAPRLAGHVKTGGSIVMAGVLETQAERIFSAYGPFSERIETAVRGGWICFAARRAERAHRGD